MLWFLRSIINISYIPESSRTGDNPMAKVKSSYKKPQPTKQLFYTGDKSQPVSNSATEFSFIIFYFGVKAIWLG